MLLKREGYPEEGELVQCIITKIQYNSVFAKILEYDKTGMIHISEISPGRIRNIRDFVTENKIVICMILKINRDRGYIDLSLRRVNNQEKILKSNEIKQEQKIEKIISNLAIQLKKPALEVYDIISKPILKKYRYIHHALEDIITGDLDIKTLDIPQEIMQPLYVIIKDKVKPKKVKIKVELKVKIYEPDGLNSIKKILIPFESENTIITYIGGGRYSAEFISSDFKTAEKNIKEMHDTIKDKIQKQKGEFEFKRLDKK